MGVLWHRTNVLFGKIISLPFLPINISSVSSFSRHQTSDVEILSPYLRSLEEWGLILLPYIPPLVLYNARLRCPTCYTWSGSRVGLERELRDNMLLCVLRGCFLAIEYSVSVLPSFCLVFPRESNLASTVCLWCAFFVVESLWFLAFVSSGLLWCRENFCYTSTVHMLFLSCHIHSHLQYSHKNIMYSHLYGFFCNFLGMFIVSRCCVWNK